MPEKIPLTAAAMAAYREGKLSIPPRARTVRDPSVYEQTLPPVIPKVVAPFTPDQVASLNRYQASGRFHEFTCGNAECPRFGPGFRLQPVLRAFEDGWHCPAPGCGYTQDWAHAWMADWSWET